MKKILGIILCFALMFCLHSNVSADIYTGSILATDGTLVYTDGSEKWSDASLSWTVDDETNLGYWTYDYTFSASRPQLSHAIIEVSPDFTFDNIISAYVNEKPVSITRFFEKDDPKSYGNEGKSNPGMPSEGIYGIKWEFSHPGLTATFTLVSDKSPMWGDFYAKGGLGQYVHNSGFGQDTDAPIGDGYGAVADIPNGGAWVLVPDTGTSVPEPGTMFLLGSGLIGIAVFARRKFKR